MTKLDFVHYVHSEFTKRGFTANIEHFDDDYYIVWGNIRISMHEYWQLVNEENHSKQYALEEIFVNSGILIHAKDIQQEEKEGKIKLPPAFEDIRIAIFPKRAKPLFYGEEVFLVPLEDFDEFNAAFYFYTAPFVGQEKKETKNDIVFLTSDTFSQACNKYKVFCENFLNAVIKNNNDNLELYRFSSLDTFVPMFNKDTSMFVVTTVNNAYGAAAIKSKKILNTYYGQSGAFYIVPSSIHELIFIPLSDGQSPLEIKSMIVDINSDSEIVSAQEFLSNTLYMYNGESVFKVL